MPSHWVRYRNLTASGAQVFVEEEQSADAEREHTTEAVGFAVFAGAGPVGGGAATYYALDGAVVLGGVRSGWDAAVLERGVALARERTVRYTTL